MGSAHPGAVEHALRKGSKRITAINETTRSGIRKRIQEAIEQGMTPAEAGAYVREWTGFDEYRAERIARTEMMFSYNEAALSTYQEIGVQQVVADDGDEDEECAERHGQVFSVSEADGIVDHPNGTLDWLPVDPGQTPVGTQLNLHMQRPIREPHIKIGSTPPGPSGWTPPVEPQLPLSGLLPRDPTQPPVPQWQRPLPPEPAPAPITPVAPKAPPSMAKVPKAPKVAKPKPQALPTDAKSLAQSRTSTAPRTYERAKSWPEARGRLEGRGLEMPRDFTMELDDANDLLAAADRLATEWPDDWAGMLRWEMGRSMGDSNAMAAYQGAYLNQSVVTLSQSKFSAQGSAYYRRIVEESRRTGWFTREGYHGSTLIHEFGHVIDYTRNGGARSLIKNWVKELSPRTNTDSWNFSYSRNAPGAAARVSGYGAKKWVENFAEAFVEAMTLPPSRWSKPTQVLWRMLHE